MPITLDPFQRITNIYWPGGGGAGDGTLYITSDCYVRMFLNDPGGESGLIDPNTYPPAPGAVSGLYTTSSRYEEFPSFIFGYPFFFDYLEVWDASGASVVNGEVASLGASILKPTLPQEETFAPWTVFIENRRAFWSDPGPELGGTPFSGYSTGGASAAFSAITLGGSAERYKSSNPGRPFDWAEAALVTGSASVNSIDLSAVSVVWQGKAFSLIGTKTEYVSYYGGYLAIRVLLMHEGSS